MSLTEPGEGWNVPVDEVNAIAAMNNAEAIRKEIDGRIGIESASWDGGGCRTGYFTKRELAAVLVELRGGDE